MKLLSHRRSRDGFALLLSIIISSVVLAIGVSIMKVSISQLQLSASSRESEVAFQASQSMAECLEFQRSFRSQSFLARPGDPDVFDPGTKLNAPAIRCMSADPTESYAEVIENSSSGHIVKFHYTIPWNAGAGSNTELCSAGDMYVMVPLTGTQRHTFVNTSVGDVGNGSKECSLGSVCTILITQGYNRPCDELETSIFTIQRELTTEF